MKFNTAIASLMTLLNEITDHGSITTEQLGIFTKLLCPFAPHICEEIWERLEGKGLCSLAEWPTYDEAKTVDSTVTIALQVLGKTRDTAEIPMDADEATALACAKKSEKFAAQIEGKQIVKTIYVKNKILNVIVR